jgi:membrane protease YdiL (CAAX protease family)
VLPSLYLAGPAGLGIYLFVVALLLILVANLAVVNPRQHHWLVKAARWVTWTTLAVLAIAAFIYAVQVWPSRLPLAIALVAAGVISLLTLGQWFRLALARVLPIDPTNPLHATAVVLTVALVGIEVGSQLSTDIIAEVAASPPLQPVDLILAEFPFLLAGLLGVGFLIRRSFGETRQRLGFVRPTWWQAGIALAAAGVFAAFGSGVDLAAQHLTPDLARKLGSANNHLYGQLNTPVGILTIALAAGIGEETLFRGALQPRMGLVWTALVFAAVHTQYGLSLDTLAVFILAIGLGVLRRYSNTTSTLICHVTYNSLVGIQLAGWLLLPAIAVELFLIATLAAAGLRSRAFT